MYAQRRPTTVRHVPTDTCPRYGTPVTPDQGMYVFIDSTPADETGTEVSGNPSEDFLLKLPHASGNLHGRASV